MTRRLLAMACRTFTDSIAPPSNVLATDPEAGLPAMSGTRTVSRFADS